jgi:hypothetical protein
MTTQKTHRTVAAMKTSNFSYHLIPKITAKTEGGWNVEAVILCQTLGAQSSIRNQIVQEDYCQVTMILYLFRFFLQLRHRT